jgi:hypothetical protein
LKRPGSAREEERREREEQERLDREQAERAESERRALLEITRASDLSRGRLLGVTLRDQNGTPRTRFRSGDSVTVEIAYRFGRRLPNPIFGFDLFRASDNQHIYTTSNHDNGLSLAALPPLGHPDFRHRCSQFERGPLPRSGQSFCRQHHRALVGVPRDEIAQAVVFDVTSEWPAQGWVHLPLHWNTESASEVETTTIKPAKTGAGVNAV